MTSLPSLVLVASTIGTAEGLSHVQSSLAQLRRLNGGGSFSTSVAPVLGATLANGMFFSGLPEVLAKRAKGDLGEFNPLPLPIIFGNCLGWLTYSFLQKDPCMPFAPRTADHTHDVAAANLPGLILAVWYVTTAVRLAEPAAARRIESLTVAMIALHGVAGCVCTWALPSREAMTSLYGLLCNGVLLAYYGAPLSTMAKVLRTRSAASIYLPTVLTNGANGAFWAAYALAIKDWYLFAPNAIGLLLATFQALLCAAFSSK